MILKRVDDQAIKIREEISKQAVELSRLDFLVPQIAEKEELTVTQPELLNHINRYTLRTGLTVHATTAEIFFQWFNCGFKSE